MHADQRLAGGQRTRSGAGPPQADHREEAEDADEDHGGFQGPHADEAQRDAFVLPLHHRVERHGGADAGEGHDQLQGTADEHACVRPGADDVVGPTHCIVEKQGRDRDEGDQVEQACGKRDLSGRSHCDRFPQSALDRAGKCDDKHMSILGLKVEKKPRISRGQLTMPRVTNAEPKGRIPAPGPDGFVTGPPHLS